MTSLTTILNQKQSSSLQCTNWLKPNNLVERHEKMEYILNIAKEEPFNLLARAS